MSLCEIFGIEESGAIERYNELIAGKNNFNMLVLAYMEHICGELAIILADMGYKETSKKIYSYDGFFLNYSDSWFCIGALDYPEDNKNKILKELIEEFEVDEVQLQEHKDVT